MERELSPRLIAVVVATLSGITLAVAGALWLWVDSLGLQPPDRATAQLDVIRVSTSVAVGGGGVFALYLAVRRQRTSEHDLRLRDRTQAHNEHVAETNLAHQKQVAADAVADAAQQRINELCTKSVDQLGSQTAPIRLGGLYSLERLAHDNSHLRPMVVEIICAYLRMPWSPPGEPPAAEAAERDHLLFEQRTQERQVRLAAQRILSRHLRKSGQGPADRPFWDTPPIDLARAYLAGHNFARTELADANLARANLRGASFSSANLKGANFVLSDLRGAKLSGATWDDRTRWPDDIGQLVRTYSRPLPGGEHEVGKMISL